MGIVLKWRQYQPLDYGSDYNIGPLANSPLSGNSNLGQLPFELRSRFLASPKDMDLVKGLRREA